MKQRKTLSLILSLVMLLSLCLSAGAQTVAELPRNETLYFGG